MYLFNPSSILSVFIACIPFFFVAPHLSMVSRPAALAMRLASLALGLANVIQAFGPMLLRPLYALNLPFEPMQAISPVMGAIFWGCLAWSLFAVMQSAPPKGLV